MERLRAFMLNRGIDEDCVKKLVNEKLDEDIIALMKENELTSIIPAMGDRYAVIKFCQEIANDKPATSGLSTNRGTGNLLSKLRAKLKLKRNREESDGSSPDEDIQTDRGKRLIGNKNASKGKRKIQLGWIDFNFKEGEYKQVRIQNGGGTRQVRVDRNAKKDDILEIAKGLFFPNGKSPRGKLSDFTLSLTDISMQEVGKDMTIGEMYDAFKVPMLRCYISTKMKRLSIAKEFDAFDDDFLTVSSEEEFPSIGCEVEVKTSSPEPQDGSIDDHFNWELAPLENTSACTSENTSSELLDCASENRDCDTVCNVHTIPDVHSDTTSGTPTVQFGPLNDREVLNITEEETCKLRDELIVLVRRSNVVDDMVNAFSESSVLDKELKVRMILPNGDVERGEGDGVYRDALSEFWASFNKCTTGNTYKVPFIRHDYGKEKWEAIGRILLKGWDDLKYLPLMLAPIFMEHCIYGKSESDLLHSFMKFVSDYERDMFEKSLVEFPERH
ncbi:uncharacterized protein [Apostichopus japonicus]|uniref:uncharacterized protein n=1 Tax=Stichopus japonicus TaxID=307972 RepID=UPI003AB72E67